MVVELIILDRKQKTYCHGSNNQSIPTSEGDSNGSQKWYSWSSSLVQRPSVTDGEGKNAWHNFGILVPQAPTPPVFGEVIR